MYELDESDTDYSYDSTDVEYNTLDPYDYDLNDFTNNRNIDETPEEKLLIFIENSDLYGVKSLLPGLLKCKDELKICNGEIKVSEFGDVQRDSSVDETSEEDEDEMHEEVAYTETKEIILKGGVTPLMVAVTYANVSIVDYILSLRVDVNYCETNSNNCALLVLVSHICVDWGHMNHNWYKDAPKCLKLLIDAGANVKVKGYLTTQDSGFTALHYAARNNYWEMLDILIHAGADIDAMNNQRETALMIAASRGHVMCCNILLLAGANSSLFDRGGCNASYMAGIENHKILSDAISVYSGSAQHNVELYKIWSQFIQRDYNQGLINQNPIEVLDNMKDTCIASFCLAIDAPYLATIMQDQGLAISDLKLMNYFKLKEMGVSDEDSDKIMFALQDFKRNTSCKNSRISFEYGKPLKIVKVLEIVGNISEHLELVDGNLECWYSHLCKKYRSDMVLHKSTIVRLQLAAMRCASMIRLFDDRLRRLRDICEGREGEGGEDKMPGGGPQGAWRGDTGSRFAVWAVLLGVAVAATAVAATVTIVSRR